MKRNLHSTCLSLIESKIDRLKKIIQEAQKSASEDTKSSAGDKFETSREMLKQEIDKNNLQLSKAHQMLKYLKQINPEIQNNAIAHGSLVYTNEGAYYFSVSLGKIAVEGKNYFALSMASPIGKALAGKKAGDEVVFMNRKIRIEKVV